MAPDMTEQALFQLLAWSSPGYPTGAFSYSHGLEWAVETGDVKNLQGLLDYVTAVICRGGGWGDAVLFAPAWRATPTWPPRPPPAPASLPAPTARSTPATPAAVTTPAEFAALGTLTQLASA